MTRACEHRDVGPYAPPARGLRRFGRAVWVLSAAWAFLGLVLTFGTLFSLVTLRIGVTRWYPRLVNFAGRTILRLGGVDVRVVNGERLRGHSARIVAFNHASQLDMFVLASLMPAGGTAVAKREILWVPFLGWAIFAFKIETIDRGNRARAEESLQRTAREIRERRATVYYSPEGTRSRDGQLGPFKMGLFHLAAATRAPIVPALIRGAKECQPVGVIVARPGLVEIEFLAPIDTADFGEDDLHQKRDALRALYVEALCEREGRAENVSESKVGEV